MESWRAVWRRGIAPSLSDAGLAALKVALTNDSPQLLQGATTSPPPLPCVHDWPPEAACLIGFCGWKGEGLTTVTEVEEYFSRVCAAADQAIGEPASCRWLLNWFDDEPRSQVVAALLPEVEREIARRVVAACMADVVEAMDVPAVDPLPF